MRQLNVTHAAYIDGLWHDMREAVRMYRKFDKQWNELNDALGVKLDKEGTTDIVQRDRVKGQNLTLAGYFSGAVWWRDKAAALAAVIQAEKAASEMLAGDGVTWRPRPRTA